MRSYINYHLLTEGPGKMGLATFVLYYVVSMINLPNSIFETAANIPLIRNIDARHMSVMLKALLMATAVTVLFAYKKKHVCEAVKSTPQVVKTSTA